MNHPLQNSLIHSQLKPFTTPSETPKTTNGSKPSKNAIANHQPEERPWSDNPADDQETPARDVKKMKEQMKRAAARARKVMKNQEPEDQFNKS
jgi:hypothetical protein